MTKAKFCSAAMMAVFVFIAAGAALLSLAPEAQATCTGADADALHTAIQNTVGPGDSASFTELPPCNANEAPHASTPSSESKFPTATGGGNYAQMTNGTAAAVNSASQATHASTNLGGHQRRGGAYDVTVLTMELFPSGNCLVLDFKFLTEEHPEHVNDIFNDGLIVELDANQTGSTWTINEGTGAVTAPLNIATDEDGDLITVKTARLSKAAAVGTTYNAGTAMLTAAAAVTPLVPIFVHISIFDAANNVDDSAAFIDNLRFTTENPATCNPNSKRRVSDHGDLPDPPYPTLTTDADATVDEGGARHSWGDPLAQESLRFSDNDTSTNPDLDAEANGQQNATATGDDTTGIDDEEDVLIPSLTAGEDVTFTARVAGSATAMSGFLHGFADWNNDNDFADAGEWLTEATPAGQPVVTGAMGASANNSLPVSVPANSDGGPTAFRFRLTSISGEMGPDGHAPDGEVEDYMINVTVLDWGDAGLGYPTTEASNGARHQLGAGGPILGSLIDKDDDGQPTATANGDDNDTDGDDEDGITNISNPVTPGSTNSFTITASGPGKLDAFIDFDGDATWDDAGEKIADNVSVAAGTSTMSFTAPSSITPGTRFARFRISTAGGLASVGKAADGEVEDYVVEVRNADFGDLPDPYPTLLEDNGPRHGITGLSLGDEVDQDLDGLPHADALGDDTEVAGPPGNDPDPGDDEDGVTISALVTGESASLTVSVTGTGGRLDGWIDFNDNDVLTDAGEQVAASVLVSPGANSVSVSVPNGAMTGETFARFRLSSLGGLAVTGSAPDGEVEDYQVEIIGQDWGDAPGTYSTTRAQNGPRHAESSSLFMGPTVDTEPDGQPTADATGDAADEDGVFFPPNGFVTRQPSTGLGVSATESGKLDAFFDWNDDGDFDAAERVTPPGGQTVSAGTNPVVFTVPSDAEIGSTFARFRISAAGGLAATGGAADGEIEDYVVDVRGLDYGDAPDADPPLAPNTYPTLLDNDGARHHQSGSATSLRLGANVDGDTDGQPNATATGDDINGNPDDEDGVAGLIATAGEDENIITVTASGGADGARFLDAWADFNIDGDWDDPGEQIFENQLLVSGPNPLTYAVPTEFPFGESATFFRFRIAAAISDVTAPTGEAPNGEVEDYRVNITQECGREIDAGKTYELSRDLKCGGSALIINGEKATVNFNGHTIEGDGTGAGVDNGAGHDQLKVNGPGQIKEFENGILSGDPGVNPCEKCKYNGGKTSETDIEITDSTGDGMLIHGLKNTIVGLLVTESGNNGLLLLGDGNKVSVSQFLLNGIDGMRVVGGTGKGKVTAKTIVANSNSAVGAHFLTGTSGKISKSTASNNGSFGGKADTGSIVKASKMTYSGNNPLGSQCDPPEQMGCA